MKCAVLESPRIMHVKEREIPKIDEGDILVKVAACAICGTDVKKYFFGHSLIKSYPIVPGHELSGTIVEVGRKAQEFTVKVNGEREIRTFNEGDRIVIAPVIACEECINCIDGRPEYCKSREDFGFNYDGGFEEYAIIPNKLLTKKICPVIPVPDKVPLYMAAISEPFACALHAHMKLIRPGKWDKKTSRYSLIQGITEGDVVVIIGGGPLGCMHAELAKNAGAGMVIIAQHSEGRLNMAKNLGVADNVILNRTTKEIVEAVDELTDGKGADIVITAASDPSAQIQALKIARQGGAISFFGGVSSDTVEIPTNKIHYNGPIITGTSGASPYHIPIILNLMAEGKIDATKYVTHLLGLHDLEKVLLLSGVPSLETIQNIFAKKGEEFLDFLNYCDFKEYETIEQKAYAFKGSILKALVVPYFTEKQNIIMLSRMSFEERRKKLTQIIQ